MHFKGNNKWSDRMRDVFTNQGKLWNDATEIEVKTCVAKAVAHNHNNALHPHKRDSIDALITALENLIQD